MKRRRGGLHGSADRRPSPLDRLGTEDLLDAAIVDNDDMRQTLLEEALARAEGIEVVFVYLPACSQVDGEAREAVQPPGAGHALASWAC